MTTQTTAEFYRREPVPRTAWRQAVLMGRNSRTYKFALGAALLECAATGRTEIPLGELAGPYALALATRLGGAPQAPATGGADDFLTVAAREAEETLAAGRPTERLVEAARRSMPGMVMDRFHNLGGGTEVEHRFYELVGRGRGRTVVLTPALRQLAASEQAPGLRTELEARWSIVESSFALGVSRGLLTEDLDVDLERSVLVDRHRRRPVTGIADAVIGFQYGRCLLCDEPITAEDKVVVDHVFPFSLMKRYDFLPGGPQPDLDRPWNLAPAHEACNSAKSDRLPTPEELDRLARRNEAVMESPVRLKDNLRASLNRAKLGGRPPGHRWPAFIRHVQDHFG
ncbi:HNH endonuclease [Kitasatospora sp. NPDC018619]|uniref:HNH endonuclease n=1 Tax=unclassified Kitasatospora TaxID=2633591 RepID=UPI0037BA9FF9